MGVLKARITRIPRQDFEEFVKENNLSIVVTEISECNFNATIEGLEVKGYDSDMGERSQTVHGGGNTPKEAVIKLSQNLSRQTVFTLNGIKPLNYGTVFPIFTISKQFCVLGNTEQESFGD